jgi:SEC-C motif-containing protein
MRAVEDPSAHPLQWKVGGEREEGRGNKESLAIPCARATRGRGLPSMDARVQMDLGKLEKVECPYNLNCSGYSMKVGRNDPCPCGSGRKFKKCHDNERFELPFLIHQARIEKHIKEEGKRLLEQHQAREIQRQAQQGLGRRIISIEHLGYRFVAVGGGLQYGKWKTFQDFLGDYIRKTLGAAWGNEEIKKPLADRHPILKWYHHVCMFQRKYIMTPGQVSSGPMTGAVSAYYRLAYNLYLIAHNVADIQTRLLSRLRNSDQFPGAFFESQVAAWLIRAGFELEFENESDRLTSHCEFTATYPSSKKRFSVEAKSRDPGKNNQGPKRLNIGRQLRLALEKQANHTRLVFLDLNQPITSEQQARRTIDRAHYLLKRVEGLEIETRPAPPAYLCLTNISDHYFLENTQTAVHAAFFDFKIPDFLGAFPTIRDAVRARERHLEMFELMRSMKKHLHIPSTFDGELPSTAFSDGKLPPMKIGQMYMAPGPGGKEVPARLSSATVDTSRGEMILGFDNGWICRATMSQAEQDDYREFPDTFFGAHLQQCRNAETPIDLFDFMYESYKNTSKEKLLEWMANASDIAELKNLTQTELSEIYCERCVYSRMADQQRKRDSKVE